MVSCLSTPKAVTLAHVSGLIISREGHADTGHLGFDLHSRFPIQFMEVSWRQAVYSWLQVALFSTHTLFVQGDSSHLELCECEFVSLLSY